MTRIEIRKREIDPGTIKEGAIAYDGILMLDRSLLTLPSYTRAAAEAWMSMFRDRDTVPMPAPDELKFPGGYGVYKLNFHTETHREIEVERSNEAHFGDTPIYRGKLWSMTRRIGISQSSASMLLSTTFGRDRDAQLPIFVGGKVQIKDERGQTVPMEDTTHHIPHLISTL